MVLCCNALHHVADESLAVHVGQARLGVVFLDLVGHRVHEVRLAETHSAVNEQRVVGSAGITGDLNRRRLGELIALSLDETVECKARIDGAAQHRRRQPARPGRRAVGRWMAAVGRHRGGCDSAGPRTHVQHHLRDRLFGESPNELLDPGQRVLAQPFDDIAIGRQELEFPVSLDRLQGPHPGVELLLREFALEHSQTAVP